MITKKLTMMILIAAVVGMSTFIHNAMGAELEVTLWRTWHNYLGVALLRRLKATVGSSLF